MSAQDVEDAQPTIARINAACERIASLDIEPNMMWVARSIKVGAKYNLQRLRRIDKNSRTAGSYIADELLGCAAQSEKLADILEVCYRPTKPKEPTR